MYLEIGMSFFFFSHTKREKAINKTVKANIILLSRETTNNF